MHDYVFNLDFHDSFTTEINRTERDHNTDRILFCVNNRCFSLIRCYRVLCNDVELEWNKWDDRRGGTKSARIRSNCYYSSLGVVTRSYHRLDCTYLLHTFFRNFITDLDIRVRRVSVIHGESPPFILVQVSPRQGRGAHSSWECILLQLLQRLLAVIQ